MAAILRECLQTTIKNADHVMFLCLCCQKAGIHCPPYRGVLGDDAALTDWVDAFIHGCNAQRCWEFNAMKHIMCYLYCIGTPGPVIDYWPIHMNKLLTSSVPFGDDIAIIAYLMQFPQVQRRQMWVCLCAYLSVEPTEAIIDDWLTLYNRAHLSYTEFICVLYMFNWGQYTSRYATQPVIMPADAYYIYIHWFATERTLRLCTSDNLLMDFTDAAGESDAIQWVADGATDEFFVKPWMVCASPHPDPVAVALKVRIREVVRTRKHGYMLCLMAAPYTRLNGDLDPQVCCESFLTMLEDAAVDSVVALEEIAMCLMFDTPPDVFTVVGCGIRNIAARLIKGTLAFITPDIVMYYYMLWSGHIFLLHHTVSLLRTHYGLSSASDSTDDIGTQLLRLVHEHKPSIIKVLFIWATAPPVATPRASSPISALMAIIVDELEFVANIGKRQLRLEDIVACWKNICANGKVYGDVEAMICSVY